MLKQCVTVSPEMLAFWGPGRLRADAWPTGCASLTFADVDGGVPLVRYEPRARCDEQADEADVVLVVQRAACRRIFGNVPTSAGSWHMPSTLRALALSIRDCTGMGAAGDTLRLGRSIELLCQTFAELTGDNLVPSDGDDALGEMDAARIAAARRLIDDGWREKHTLASIARACGLNRDKLARGFRAAYRVTVADALAQRRLEGARTLLLTSDLPVATVGHRCGYLNKASFARAFGRHFGYPPTQLRRQRAIAA